MKRVGLIDNLRNPDEFLAKRLDVASAQEVLTATGGNTGNVAFVYGTRRLIENPITRIDWGLTPDVVRHRVDHIVVCCANQLGQHADLGDWAADLERFDLPVTLVGLGAQSKDLQTEPVIPAGTAKFLETVGRLNGALASNISVRGDFTRAFLARKRIDAAALGCPSQFIASSRSLGKAVLNSQDKRTVERIAVAAGNPWHTESAALERVLVEIVEQYRGEYVLQHPEEMFQFALADVDGIGEATTKRFLEVYGERFTKASLLAWYRQNSCFFVDAPNWLRFLSKFDLALGPRYHGVALAIQAGIPGTVITIDSRTTELCAGTGIKSLPVATALKMTAIELIDASRWTDEDAMRFDLNRVDKARGYVQFIEDNGLQPSSHLRNLTVMAAA